MKESSREVRKRKDHHRRDDVGLSVSKGRLGHLDDVEEHHDHEHLDEGEKPEPRVS